MVLLKSSKLSHHAGTGDNTLPQPLILPLFAIRDSKTTHIIALNVNDQRFIKGYSGLSTLEGLNGRTNFRCHPPNSSTSPIDAFAEPSYYAAEWEWNPEAYSVLRCPNLPSSPSAADPISIGNSSDNTIIATLNITQPFHISKSSTGEGSFSICGNPLRAWPHESILKSWLEYHFQQGCAHISLHTCNTSRNETPSYLHRYMNLHRVSITEVCRSDIDDPFRSMQVYSNNLCFLRYQRAVHWVAVIDVDEYLHINSSSASVKSILARHNHRQTSVLFVANQMVGMCSMQNWTLHSPNPREEHSFCGIPFIERRKGIYSTFFRVHTFLGVHDVLPGTWSVFKVLDPGDMVLYHYYALMKSRLFEVPFVRGVLSGGSATTWEAMLRAHRIESIPRAKTS